MKQGEATDIRVMGKLRTGVLVEAMSGGAGDVVVSRTRSGMATRSKPSYRYPKVPAVQEGVARLRAANALWNAMGVAEAEEWNRYAATLSRRDPFTGKQYAPSGKNVLVALASKYMQANPGAPIPVSPPTSPYLPPSGSVTVSAACGGARFEASEAPPPGTVVELMIQRLVNGKRKPTSFYKSAAFTPFSEGSLEHTIPLSPGWYAVAYQYVEQGTGRTQGMLTLGKIEVA